MSQELPTLIRVNGRFYRLAEPKVRTAQLQQVLQQYETATQAILKALTDAHKAAMGKQFDRAGSILQQVTCEKIDQLGELNKTMAGIVGLEGG